MKARLVKFGEIEVEGKRYTHDVVIDGGEAYTGSLSAARGSEEGPGVRHPALHVLRPSVRWRSQAEFFQDFFNFLVGELVYAFVFVGVAVDRIDIRQSCSPRRKENRR